MRLLVVTNLYPPRVLGGFGRCISDFVGSLLNRGHVVQVLSSDAPYLTNINQDCSLGPNGEPVSRKLNLKGSYKNGVSQITDEKILAKIDSLNFSIIRSHLDTSFDAILLGNIDLLGVELISLLLLYSIPILHHIGFIAPPYPSSRYINSPFYHLIPASHAVRSSLIQHGFPLADAPVIYPGARCDLFSPLEGSISHSLRLSLSLVNHGMPIGSPSNPLKLAYAGILMSSKGAHTLISSIITLHNLGYSVYASIAGANFQAGYKDFLISLLEEANCSHLVHFFGHLNRSQLSRFWSLHHVGIFTSIYPEAFGIVAAEIMASGLALVSTGVGGAKELIDDRINGIFFQPNDPDALVDGLLSLISSPELLSSIASSGHHRVMNSFTVEHSVTALESILTT